MSQNDILRITKNGYSLEGKRINNGDIATVAGFTKNGDVRLTNGATLPAIGGPFTYGYVTTSHASQSRSEDKVIIAQSAASFAASSARQFYVSASRGEKEISIYTCCSGKQQVEHQGCVMTVTEASIQIGISPSKLYQLVADHKIAHYRIGGKIVFHDDDIAAFLAGCRIPTAQTQSPSPMPRLKLKHITLNGSA